MLLQNIFASVSRIIILGYLKKNHIGEGVRCGTLCDDKNIHGVVNAEFRLKENIKHIKLIAIN